jgi:hypothetical protein
MTEHETGLWKYNPTTGIWTLCRTCLQVTAENWMAIFKKDEPDATFIISRKKPKQTPPQKEAA